MADRGMSPRVSGTVDLGSASRLWRKVYAGRIDEGTYIPGAFNKKETFTTSGTFVAPVTGVYRITLQGGGGGGAGAGTTGGSRHASGGGGGAGANYSFYITLTDGTSYSYNVGAGGAGGAAGSATASTGTDGTSGGNTSISLAGTTITCEGGRGGYGYAGLFCGGVGGRVYIGGIENNIFKGISGSPGTSGGNGAAGGVGGGNGGSPSSNYTSIGGGGGNGGAITNAGAYSYGSAGGDGYIEIEWYDPTV